MVRSVADIDWSSWTPTDRATLLFVVETDARSSGRDDRHGRILLIEKKRGLGAGKVNGPGGRIDPGESAMAAALRELREELCVGATGVVEHGELSFHFVDGYMLHCHVFRADACEGEPAETDEATPLWTPLDAIPFHRMWADDALWLPMLIAGQAFRGRFIFDGDHMVDHELARLGPVSRPVR
jgi:8-oxo-dGTP diphosphatase